MCMAAPTATETSPFDAFLEIAEQLGADVKPIEGTDNVQIQHDDNLTISRLWCLARSVGDAGAIFGHNRFLAAPPCERGF